MWKEQVGVGWGEEGGGKAPHAEETQMLKFFPHSPDHASRPNGCKCD